VGVGILYGSIPGAKDASAILGDGFFTVPCNATPTVGITLANQIFNVAPSIFNLGVLEGNDCVGGVVALDGICELTFPPYVELMDLNWNSCLGSW
jgi:hypothetical protein